MNLSESGKLKELEDKFLIFKKCVDEESSPDKDDSVFVFAGLYEVYRPICKVGGSSRVKVVLVFIDQGCITKNKEAHRSTKVKLAKLFPDDMSSGLSLAWSTKVKLGILFPDDIGSAKRCAAAAQLLFSRFFPKKLLEKTYQNLYTTKTNMSISECGGGFKLRGLVSLKSENHGYQKQQLITAKRLGYIC
ncbi:hypothetical protein Tco_1016474 [Tanacetum coccineum]|uniref:Uncharacterized protein n=1 Tax=Tanacetum coccineum TaxID=301880 RepID=A0ABQ5FP93_9ASTR